MQVPRRDPGNCALAWPLASVMVAVNECASSATKR
jgi:hypothetical protein